MGMKDALQEAQLSPTSTRGRPFVGDASLKLILPSQLLADAKRVAAARDENVSQVVRRALRAYVANGLHAQTDIEDLIAADKALDRPVRRRQAKGG